MFDWEDLRHFSALAAAGSLSSAARALKVNHATIARRVAALETSLDLKLVDRRARSYELTADGRRVAEFAARMHEQALTLARTARGAHPSPSGLVSISAPPMLASSIIAPRLRVLRDEYPDLHIQLIGEKRAASLAGREADIAVRLSRPTRGALVARKVASLPFALYASPQYLAAHSPANFAFIGYDEAADELPQQRWLKRIAGTRPLVFRTSELEAQWAAARAGVGVAALPALIAAKDIQLVRVSAVGSRAPTRDVWVVMHRDLSTAAPVRAVADFLRACFA